jgi:hypothetical protein
VPTQKGEKGAQMDEQTSNKPLAASEPLGIKDVLLKLAESSPDAVAVITVGVSTVTAVGSPTTAYPTMAFATACLLIYVWLRKRKNS